MGEVAGNDVAQIKEGEALVDVATKKLNALKVQVNSVSILSYASCIWNVSSDSNDDDKVSYIARR